MQGGEFIRFRPKDRILEINITIESGEDLRVFTELLERCREMFNIVGKEDDSRGGKEREDGDRQTKGY